FRFLKHVLNLVFEISIFLIIFFENIKYLYKSNLNWFIIKHVKQFEIIIFGSSFFHFIFKNLTQCFTSMLMFFIKESGVIISSTILIFLIQFFIQMTHMFINCQ